jgi:hypothetical protein
MAERESKGTDSAESAPLSGPSTATTVKRKCTDSGKASWGSPWRGRGIPYTPLALTTVR